MPSLINSNVPFWNGYGLQNRGVYGFPCFTLHSAIQKEGSVANGNVEEKRTKKKKKKKKTSNKKEVPLYWRVDTDIFHGFQSEGNKGELGQSTKGNSEENNSTMRFVVRGKPVPLRRHRTSRGFMYNPSAKAQEEFGNVVKTFLPQDMISSQTPSTQRTVFSEDAFLAVSLIFRMRRPRIHFVGSKAGEGRLKEAFSSKLAPTSRTDVDNLAKFVLDTFNGLVYVDDRQVVSLSATKVYDCDGDCEGATEVSIRCLSDSDIDSVLLNQHVC
eukprot:CAMPEP_0195509100 /NCGR_PEP_ID=MMETSP0794_2-20130614/2118_1 /TAXON_ID=515487 /ORGANISM="Stephanopyxis turris, Strain CCMP 815" /LENGTH=270 /DNA_ID=CAMNT_0040636227 /DNA_START=145 /DNA_END=957 /DNA_ORIENTATION=+